MISAEFFYNEQHRLNGFKIEGHAGYADSGFDIICSAVSVLTINTVNSIDRLTDDYYEFEQDEAEGLMILRMEEFSEASEILLRSLRIGIEGIVEEYGNGCVRII